MRTIQIDIPDIPHGHGMSFKRGVADGLLDCREHEEAISKTNSASYKRGLAVGEELKSKIAKLVKD